MLSMLAQGNTGSEILQILDTLIDDNQQAVAYNEPTADVIDFWYVGGALIDFCAPYVMLGDDSGSAVFCGGFLWCRAALRI